MSSTTRLRPQPQAGFLFTGSAVCCRLTLSRRRLDLGHCAWDSLGSVWHLTLHCADPAAGLITQSSTLTIMPTAKQPAPRKPSSNGHSSNGKNGHVAKDSKTGKVPEIKQLSARKRNPGNPHPKPPPVEFQFKPGQSGNPGGRPKQLRDAYSRWLADVDPELNLTNAEKAAQVMGAEVLAGGENGVRAARELRGATAGDILTVKYGKMSDEELLTFVRQQRQVVDDLLSGGNGVIVEGTFLAGETVGAAMPADPLPGEAMDADDPGQP